MVRRVYTTDTTTLTLELISPQLNYGSALFKVNLNYELNIVQLNAVAPNALTLFIGLITIETSNSTIKSLSRVLINSSAVNYIPYLFYVVADYQGEYAGIIGLLPHHDPENTTHLFLLKEGL